MEETKEMSHPNMTGIEDEDEYQNDLFKHLTYLSQLSNDVSKH